MKEKKEQAYTLIKEIQSNGATVRVFSPIISDEERARRMKIIRNAAVDLLKAERRL